MASAAEQWAERVRRQERSGLSLRKFAAREGLKAGSLSFWKWKLGQERGGGRRKAASISPVRFVELRAEPLGPPAPAQAFEIELRSGRRVRVGVGFDAAELARLVMVLEEARS